jgi:hypothetical protein
VTGSNRSEAEGRGEQVLCLMRKTITLQSTSNETRTTLTQLIPHSNIILMSKILADWDNHACYFIDYIHFYTGILK